MKQYRWSPCSEIKRRLKRKKTDFSFYLRKWDMTRKINILLNKNYTVKWIWINHTARTAHTAHTVDY